LLGLLWLLVGGDFYVYVSYIIYHISYTLPSLPFWSFSCSCGVSGVLNLRVSYLGGGNKRAKRSTSAADGLSTEWT
jgi:hypothetical protein